MVDYCVNGSEALLQVLENLLGEQNVKFLKQK